MKTRPCFPARMAALVSAFVLTLLCAALLPCTQAQATTADKSQPTVLALTAQGHKLEITLNKTKVYVGQKPSVKSVLIDGKAANYKYLTFNGVIPRGAGIGKITAKGTKNGPYEGLSATKKFKVIPYCTTLNSVTATVGGFKATWGLYTSYTTGYQLQYSTTSDFSSYKTITIANTNTTSKSVTGLKEKKTYYVRVRTYADTSDGRMVSPWSSKYSVTTKATQTQATSKYQPTQKLTITNLYRSGKYCKISHSMASSWYNYDGSASGKVSGYEVQYDDNKYFSSPTMRTTFDKYNTSYSTSTLSKNTTYYFRVRLFNTVKAKTYYGPWSAVKSTNSTSTSGAVG